jgi:predicted DNA-binding antitoxin AbrB/MazE fold protein
MSQTIEAIYENGVFKPLAPVNLPEGAPVQVEPQTFPVEEQIRQRLLAEGVDPAEIERILANFRLAWSAFANLTPEEEAALEEARLDQQHFFDRPPAHDPNAA